MRLEPVQDTTKNHYKAAVDYCSGMIKLPRQCVSPLFQSVVSLLKTHSPTTMLLKQNTAFELLNSASVF